MKKIKAKHNFNIHAICMLILFYSWSFGYCQNKDNNKINNNIKPLFNPDKNAKFPGGIDSLISFINKNTKYPDEAKNQNISGNVYIQFIIETDGSIDSIKVKKGLGYGCDEEAIRVIKLMPKWIPGKNEGKPCRVAKLLPIGFNLKKEEDEADCNNFHSYDKISKNGNYIKYIVKGKNAHLEYGNKLYRKVLPGSYECGIGDAQIPWLLWDNQDFICVKYGCGLPCWGVKILPLDSTKEVQDIMYNLEFDLKDNLIAYLGDEDYDKIIVKNYNENKQQKIEMPFNCNSAFMGFCCHVDSLSKDEIVFSFRQINNFKNDTIIDETEHEYRVKLYLK